MVLRGQLVAIICGVLGIVGLFYSLWQLSTSLFAALILAYITYPWVDRLSKLGMPIGIWVCLGFLCVMIAAFLASAVLLPILIRDLHQLLQLLFEQLNSFYLWGASTIQKWGLPVVNETSSMSEVWLKSLPSINGASVSWLLPLFKKGLLGFSSIFLLVFSLCLFPVLYYYMLTAHQQLYTGFIQLFPLRYQTSVAIFLKDSHLIFSNYFRGQLSILWLLSLYYGLGLWALSIKGGFFIGLMTGFLNLIPYVGVVLGFCLSILMLAVDFSWFNASMIVVIFICGHVLEQFILIPYLIGERLQLSAFEMLLAILLGGHLLGLLGMIVILPITAVLKRLMVMILRDYRYSDFYRKTVE